MNDLPIGTVTFLFTDIEGSTKLLHQLGEGYVTLLADHHRLMRGIFTKWNGREVDTEGDAFFVSFSRATDAVSATVAAQRALIQHDWPEGVSVKVRMGLHTGEPWSGGEGYVGIDVHRAARIAHVGYGGQVLLSETTAALVLDQLPEEAALLDLGRHRLKDMKRPEHIRQLVIDGLPGEFPPLKTLGVVTDPAPSYLEAPEMPAFLEKDAAGPDQPVFVGRERELAWLEERTLDGLAAWDQAEAPARGQVLFVIGEAGMGKSSLLRKFAHKAAKTVPNLLVTWGQGNAFSGQGDPYLPFREVFAQLGGNIESPWRAGQIDTLSAGRLWRALPKTAEIISRDGDDLLDYFVSVEVLIRNVKSASPKAIALHNRLRDLSNRDHYRSGSAGQAGLFTQVVSVLEKLSVYYPLLIILDDLQWVDQGTVDLLFQIGRSLLGKRVLIVVAYRPEDVTQEQKGERHPLRRLLEEFKRLFGDTTLDLAQAEAKRFVDDFVDSEPNMLSKRFRDRLLRRTGGQALFIVELLRDMQERGDIKQDEQGYWVESEELNWDKLPAKIEGVLESRIGRLESSLRETLTIASVEGESFTAQVVARVQKLQERQTLRSLSRDLALRHHLVREQQTAKVGRQLLSRYRFAHALFQRYLYNEISAAERRILHEEIADILEDIYAAEKDSIAYQLARHYLEAGDDDKALKYLMTAGDQARQISAYQEAINQYRTALSLAETNHLLEESARILMKMGLTYSLTMDYEKTSSTYHRAFSLWQRVSAVSDQTALPLSSRPLRLASSDPGPIDPSLAVETSQGTIVSMLFSGLVQRTVEGDIFPDIAERWDFENDGRRYIFHLRSDVFWRDGHPVTAHDFEYAWKRLLSRGGWMADNLRNIRGAEYYVMGGDTLWEKVGIKAEDDRTFVVELEERAGNFMQLLAQPHLFPVPRHIVEDLVDDWANGPKLISNGPFVLESLPPEGDTLITCTRNPNYHGRATGNVKRVVISRRQRTDQYLEYSRLINIYASDQLDVLHISNMPAEQIKEVKIRFADDYLTGPQLSTRYLVINPAKPPLDDVRLRQAMAMTVDRMALRDALGSSFDIATGGLIPPGMAGHSPAISFPFEPDKARELLKSAHYTDENEVQPITALYHSTRAAEMLSPITDWSRLLGLNIAPELISWNTLVRHTRQELPHIYRTAWVADYPDPQNFLESAIFPLRSIWKHPEFESLIGDAAKELDQSKRLELYQQADRILIEEAVVIPIAYERIHMLVKPWVRKWSLSPYADVRLENVIIEPH